MLAIFFVNFIFIHYASKEVFWPNDFLNFMHRFKSAILPEYKNCQNGTIEPVHEIQKFFRSKGYYENDIYKKYR